jgi:hypothetical protein
MDILKKLLICGLAGFVLTGCECDRPPAYNVSMRMDGVQPRDIVRADHYRTNLPTILWLPSSQIGVQPAVGITDVTVTGAADPAIRDAVIADVAESNAQHPFDLLRLKFQ